MACAAAPQSSVPEVQRIASGLQPVQVLERIAFRSCNREWLPQPFWTPILETHPDLWIWLGDNIYADTEDMEVMRQKGGESTAPARLPRRARTDGCVPLSTHDVFNRAVRLMMPTVDRALLGAAPCAGPAHRGPALGHAQ